MVVTAIVALITGIVLANNNRFGGVVLLENLAYDIALSVRQAQVNSISVVRFSSDNFNAGYGMSFKLSTPNTYTLFADTSGNGLYDCTAPGTGGCELVSATTVQLGYRILSLCATPVGGSETCSGISSLDVLFVRPEPDAWISINGNSCILSHSSCQEGARIIVESPQGGTRSIVVEANGQISVGR